VDFVRTECFFFSKTEISEVKNRQIYQSPYINDVVRSTVSSSALKGARCIIQINVNSISVFNSKLHVPYDNSI
jgi:hypothetical protein